jgi:hypothetical protein
LTPFFSLLTTSIAICFMLRIALYEAKIINNDHYFFSHHTVS